MTSFFYIIVSALLTISFGTSAVTKDNKISAQIQNKVQPEMQSSPQQNPILARDYYTAKKALDEAVQKKDLTTIALGLKGFSFEIRKDVVTEIKKLDDKSFIPDLIEALEDNQGDLSGGSEVQHLQQELNNHIVSTLEQLTGLCFSYTENSSKDDIERIVKQSREWWESYKKERL